MTDIIQESATPNLCRFEDLPDGPFRDKEFPKSLFIKVSRGEDRDFGHVQICPDGSVKWWDGGHGTGRCSGEKRLYPVSFTKILVTK